MPLGLFIFQIESCVYPGPAGPISSYLCFLISWADRHAALCPAFFGWDGVSPSFFSGCSQAVSFPITASQVARLTSIIHHIWLVSFFNGRWNFKDYLETVQSKTIPSLCCLENAGPKTQFNSYHVQHLSEVLASPQLFRDFGSTHTHTHKLKQECASLLEYFCMLIYFF
jgi:hypothetical protein